MGENNTLQIDDQNNNAVNNAPTKYNKNVLHNC